MHTSEQATGLVVVTRVPSPAMAACELTFMERAGIDFTLAARQHTEYVQVLRSLGLESVTLSPEPDLPDGVFVEDVALVFDEATVLASPCQSRRPEVASAVAVLARYRRIHRLPPGASLEGGDVLRNGHTVYVGQSSRTCPAGLEALERIIAPCGYRVQPVPVRKCLHLSTGASILDSHTLLVNSNWIDTAPFVGLDIIEVPEEEPWAANVLGIAGTIVMPAGMPLTRDLLEGRGYTVRTVDISEFLKSEAGVSCMGLVFPGRTRVS